MPTIAEDGTFTQVARFEVAPERQGAPIAAIAAEVERWVRHRPGFVSSALYASLDGQHVLNHAQWRSEAEFEAFTRDPEGERLGAAIRAVGPSGGPQATAYHAARSIEASQGRSTPRSSASCPAPARSRRTSPWSGPGRHATPPC